MRIVKNSLANIVRNILKEGKAEDLVSQYPQLKVAYDRGIRKEAHLRWLLKMERFEPITDTLGLISAFEINKQRLSVKDLGAYNNPNDLRSALEEIGDSEGNKRHQLKKEETDIVYESETWLVVMPHTMESSIQWGKGTTWCTAATKSANLFYNYVGREFLYSYTGKEIQDTILYYIIRKGADSKADPNAKLSVGFTGGVPQFDGNDGGLTVNSSNNGLAQSSLEKILGEEKSDIMKAMISHSKKIGGQHPAKKIMKKMARAKDPSILDRYMLRMEEEQIKDFLSILLEYEVSPEILAHLANSDDPVVRSLVASNHCVSRELLSILSHDDNNMVREIVARDNKTPANDLARLARDESLDIRLIVAENWHTPAEVLNYLATDRHEDASSYTVGIDEYVVEQIKAMVASNINTDPRTLTFLSKNDSLLVKRVVANNPKTPIRDLIRLLKNEDEEVKANVENNPTYQKYLASTPQLFERWMKW